MGSARNTQFCILLIQSKFTIQGTYPTLLTDYFTILQGRMPRGAKIYGNSAAVPQKIRYVYKKDKKERTGHEVKGCLILDVINYFLPRHPPRAAWDWLHEC